MRTFLFLTPFLLLAASAIGCGSKAPAGSDLPPGVIENRLRPDPKAIERRKLMLIDPRKRNITSRLDGQR